MTATPAHIAIWIIATLAAVGVVIRPFRLPEAVWAVGGAAIMLGTGLLPLRAGLAAIAKGTDVYLFLAGMMLLSEVARSQGVFDWIAARAVNLAHGRPKRLFTLIYLIGVVVTTFLSNDAAAVVLTPAVLAAAKQAKAEPVPLLFICAFIANAASFVLPISNPANLVLYGDVPPLMTWLGSFALPSFAAIGVTYIVLRLVEGRELGDTCAVTVEPPALSLGGRTALGGIGLTAIALTMVSALGIPLGLPTFAMGIATATAALWRSSGRPWPLVKAISWGVMPLVAGLFSLVAAVDATGLAGFLAEQIKSGAASSVAATAADAGTVLALASNAMNNLPAGLIASSALHLARPPKPDCRCDADCCRSRPKPIDHRIARDDPVAHRDPS